MTSLTSNSNKLTLIRLVKRCNRFTEMFVVFIYAHAQFDYFKSSRDVDIVQRQLIKVQCHRASVQ